MANVPIVTEVTKAQLDALVAANGLNEGLQYKVTDLGYIALATGNNTYIITGQIPYKKWIGYLTNIDYIFGFVELENTFNEVITWDNFIENEVPVVGVYTPSKATPFDISKIFFPNVFLILDYLQLTDGQYGFLYTDTTSIWFNVLDSTGTNTGNWGIAKVFVEIREYY